MEPSRWGPVLWKTFHIVAAAYPRQPTQADRERYQQFYDVFGKVLPCMKCRNNYVRHMAAMPVVAHLADRDTLFGWTVAFHNTVNKSLGKRGDWTAEDAMRAHILASEASEASEAHADPLRPAVLVWVLLAIVLALLLVAIARTFT
ncbi:hypothetical protein FOA52_004172 [Chlamydomonas sp. UWO 241]|nr:hypothetical protein FOA52_004172 [Chlamydomonas sp. UWO 241]